MFYREIVVRAYGQRAIKKVDLLRKSGINMTDLIMKAIMSANIKELKRGLANG